MLYIQALIPIFTQLNIIIFMQQDHDRIVQKIEKKMAGASMLKSEQEKKQQIFQYGDTEQNQANGDNQNGGSIQRRTIISAGLAERSLEQIYIYYVNSYIQPRKHFQTFDNVNQRRLTFQPFILFMKNFRILKIIFPLQKIKLFFKKYANFGQYLTSQNFFFLINQLSHQKQARDFFNIEQIQHKASMDIQSVQQLQKQQFYYYMNLHSPDKYRLNFKNVFQPFFCNSKVDTKKIKYTYRKFSQPELLKKSFKPMKNMTQEKQLYVVKNKDIPLDQNPFSQVKSIVVSWQSLRSKSVANIQKSSAEIVKKKYVKDEPDDDEFLREYQQKKMEDRRRLEKRIEQLTKQQSDKDRLLLAKLQRKTAAPKSLILKSSKVK